MSRETREAAERMRSLDREVRANVEKALAAFRASSIDASARALAARPADWEPGPPATLDDDPGFTRALETLDGLSDMVRGLSSAFTEYVEASERESVRNKVFNALSLVVAALSLAVTFVSLLGQFGIVG